MNAEKGPGRAGKWEAPVESTKRSRAITSIAILVAAVFLWAGGSKLLDAASHVEQFAHWGYPSWFVYVIGLVEVGAAILLVVPATRFYGAALLTCNLLGIVYTHIKAGEFTLLPAPIVLLMLATFIAWSRRPPRRA